MPFALHEPCRKHRRASRLATVIRARSGKSSIRVFRSLGLCRDGRSILYTTTVVRHDVRHARPMSTTPRRPAPASAWRTCAHQCILPHKIRPSHQRLYDWFVRKTIKNARIFCSARPARESSRRPASSTRVSFTVATKADDPSRNTICAGAEREKKKRQSQTA